MKRTLMITILAAALLGGQIFAAESRTYNLSEYSNGSKILHHEFPGTIVVNAQIEMKMISYSGSLTLEYRDDFFLNASEYLDFLSMTSCNITASEETASHWEALFSNSQNATIKLAHAEDEIMLSEEAQYLFFGQNKGDKVKLGNAEVVFKGVVPDLSHLQANEVGLLISSNDLKLAGVINQSVPEPTTGFLSLLALAGLCSRRRKK